MVEDKTYSTLKTLILSNKLLLESSIDLEEKSNHPVSKHGEVELRCLETQIEMKLDVELNSVYYKYNLRIFAKSLHPKPFIRFDSTGATHKNRNHDLTLVESIIPTPHFQKLTKNENWFAFRTPVIDQYEDQIKTDISFGAQHFCITTNCGLNNDGVFQINSNELEYSVDLKSSARRLNNIPF